MAQWQTQQGDLRFPPPTGAERTWEAAVGVGGGAVLSMAQPGAGQDLRFHGAVVAVMGASGPGNLAGKRIWNL